jgi:hypothetical protein
MKRDQSHPEETSVHPEIEAFVCRVIDESSQLRAPELFSGELSDLPYFVQDRHGVSVAALRTRSLPEEQLIKLLKFRWGQYLHPTVSFNSARVAYETGLEHEPLSKVLPDDVHIIAGSVETGQILCYAVFRSLPDAPTGTTLRTRERPLLPVEQVHGWGIFNRLRILPDLPFGRLRELGRFVRNQQLHTFSELGARAPVEVSAAITRLLVGPLRMEVDAIAGDLEEGVARQNFDFFHGPLILLPGTVPYEPEDGLLFERYQYCTVYPFALLTADLVASMPRLDEIEQALSLPGKQALLALFRLKRLKSTVKSSLEPPQGLSALSATELQQQELAMPERRQLLDASAHLRTTDLFGDLSVAEAALLGTFMQRREIEAGQVIIRQGGKGDDLFLIEAGQAEVRMKDLSGQSVHIRTMGPGDYFGEIGLLTEGLRTADVIAETPMTVLQLNKDAYTRYLAHVVEVAQQISQTAASRASYSLRKLISDDPG